MVTNGTFLPLMVNLLALGWTCANQQAELGNSLEVRCFGLASAQLVPFDAQRLS